jgi:hypothetical protein
MDPVFIAIKEAVWMGKITFARYPARRVFLWIGTAFAALFGAASSLGENRDICRRNRALKGLWSG